MKRGLPLLIILCAGLAAGTSTVSAQDVPKPQVKKAEKRPAKKPIKKKTESKVAAPVTEEDEAEPDIAGSTATDFSCELGNKVTIYRIQNDDTHIALRWKKRLMRLTKVDTTTGAHRFENSKIGLVWLGIPAKGILLDSKKGQQLANECKSAEQSALKPESSPSTPLMPDAPPLAQPAPSL